MGAASQDVERSLFFVLLDPSQQVLVIMYLLSVSSAIEGFESPYSRKDKGDIPTGKFTGSPEAPRNRALSSFAFSSYTSSTYNDSLSFVTTAIYFFFTP